MAVIQVELLNGTTADANDVMDNFDEIYDNITEVNVASANKTGSGKFVLQTSPVLAGTVTGTYTLGGTVTFGTTTPQLVPIGSIIPFYDFNAALTFNTTYWAYCNGQSIAVGSIGSQTLPDLSGRYLVGFGTDGGGNNGSAAWATATVGNAGNTVNIAHTHSVPAHYHGKGDLNITSSGSHSHTLLIQDAGTTAAAGATVTTANVAVGGNNMSTGVAQSASHTHASASFSGSVGNTGGVDGDSAMTSGSSLSSSQSIQPISIRVRYLMRIL